MTIPPSSDQQLTPVTQIDLAAFALYSGHRIQHVDIVDGMVRFHFCKDVIENLQSQIATGQASVDLCRWRSVLAQLRHDYLTDEAKRRLRSRLKQINDADGEIFR